MTIQVGPFSMANAAAKIWCAFCTRFVTLVNNARIGFAHFGCPTIDTRTFRRFVIRATRVPLVQELPIRLWNILDSPLAIVTARVYPERGRPIVRTCCDEPLTIPGLQIDATCGR